MGHLDPFLQDLNGIGIIAMMVSISAVIVRVVFCKTMRDRIYTGVLGLISAIVIVFGLRRPRPLGRGGSKPSSFHRLL